MDYYEIGQRIRKMRKVHELSQEELAEIIGISTTHMSHIETGNTKLSLPVLVAISLALLLMRWIWKLPAAPLRLRITKRISSSAALNSSDSP